MSSQCNALAQAFRRLLPEAGCRDGRGRGCPSRAKCLDTYRESRAPVHSRCRGPALILDVSRRFWTRTPTWTSAADPSTVTRSLWPRTLTRSTQKPVSALWNVTRSTSPAKGSRARPWSAVTLSMGRLDRHRGYARRQRGVVLALRSRPLREADRPSCGPFPARRQWLPVPGQSWTAP